MALVVDANILFSALLKPGITRKILLFFDFDFCMPEYSIQEFEKHLPELQKKSGFEKEELSYLLNLILQDSETKIIPFEEFENQTSLAKSISPDEDDSPYLALALHLGCPIWSNDSALKKQNIVRVFNTKELLEKILIP